MLAVVLESKVGSQGRYLMWQLVWHTVNVTVCMHEES